MKPMLAAATDGTNITYPVLVSPKLDGVRALVLGGVVVSRSLKPIPNKHVQKLFGKKKYEGFDGELLVGIASAEDAFQSTQSGVMTIEGKPEVNFHVFDILDKGTRPFSQRLAKVLTLRHKFILPVEHTLVHHEDELTYHERCCIDNGFEGLMIRHPDGLYKFGRSTLKQGWLLKLKRFEDSEAEIIDFQPLFHNANERVKNALGYSERNSKKEGKVAKDTLGAIKVRDLKTKVIFDIGTGFTQKQRIHIWNTRTVCLRQVVKYKFQPTGVKDKPRFPVFLGFRDPIDMS